MIIMSSIMGRVRARCEECAGCVCSFVVGIFVVVSVRSGGNKPFPMVFPGIS